MSRKRKLKSKNMVKKMSNKRGLKKLRRKKKKNIIDESSVDQNFRQIFLGEGAEPITDSLIKELVEKGWSEKDLKWYQEQGSLYSRP